MSDVEDAVALSVWPGLTPRRLGRALDGLRPSPAEARRLGSVPGLVEIVGWIAAHSREAVDVAALRARAGAHLERAAAGAIEVVHWYSDEYPGWLRTIIDPPPVLWMTGQRAALVGPGVALVGSRAASPYALDVAARLGTDLASRGVTVISGLARGVDAAAHQGALSGQGRTLAVLGSGVDVVYPAEHRALADRIGEQGAVVSELPPGAPPLPGHFPRRNRIISGLARAVVVVEAAARSGSLITALAGLEQGREVMAVPGNVLAGRNRGAHGLLKDGAKIVEDADDILGELGLHVAAASPEVAPPVAQDPVLRALSAGEAQDADEIAARCELPVSEVLCRLLVLEIEGVIARLDDGRFKCPLT